MNLLSHMNTMSGICGAMEKLLLEFNASIENYDVAIIPSELWKIVSSYACEDPRIIGVIVNQPHYVSIKNDSRHLVVDVRDRRKPERQLIVKFGNQTMATGIDVLKLLLMYPLRDVISGEDLPWECDIPGIIGIRIRIYGLLKWRDYIREQYCNH